MSYSTREIIDAVLQDLENNVQMPDHGTFCYADSRALRYDVKSNWLQVFPTVEAHAFVSTVGTYENTVTVCVEWSTQTFKGVESNTDDQDIAKNYLAVSDQISDRLREYAGGVPGLDGAAAAVSEVKWDLRPGPAWVAQVNLRVEIFRGEC